MSETQRYYDRLTDEATESIDNTYLARALHEIASGVGSFGEMANWRAWSMYLLAHVLDRARCGRADRILMDACITAFIALHSDGVLNTYKGYDQDTRAAVGGLLWSPEYWAADGGFRPPVYRDNFGEYGIDDASSTVSCHLFWNIKYLADDQIDDWASFLFGVDDGKWMATLATWLTKARPFLEEGGFQPKEFQHKHWALTWFGVESLRGWYGTFDGRPLIPFIPASRGRRFLGVAGRSLLEHVARWESRLQELDDIYTQVEPIWLELQSSLK